MKDTKIRQTLSIITIILCSSLLMGLGGAPKEEPSKTAPITLNRNVSKVKNSADAAYIIAQDIQSPSKKMDVMIRIAGWYAAEGDIERAQLIANEIQAKELNIKSMRVYPEIIVNLAETGNHEFAMQMIKNWKKSSEKTIAAEYLAYYYLKEKEFDKASQAIALIPSAAKKSTVYSKLTLALADDGQFEKALPLVEKITDKTEKQNTQIELIKGLAQTNYLDLAMEIVANVQEPEIKYDLQAEIAKKIAESGQFNEALEIAEKIESSYYKDIAIAYIAVAGSEQNHLNPALGLSKNIIDQDILEQATSKIIAAYAKNDELDFALKNIETIKTPEYKDVTYFRIAKELALQENFDQAMEMLDKVKDADKKEEYTIELAGIFGNSPQYHYTQLLIKQLNPETLRRKALSKFIITYAPQSTPQRAKNITQSLEDLTLIQATYEQIALSYIQAKRYQDAIDMIQNITPTTAQLDSMFVIIEELIAQNQVKETQKALQIALTKSRSLEDPGSRYKHSVEIAVLFKNFGNIKESHNAAEQALSILPQLEDPEVYQKTNETLATLFEFLGQPLQALDVVAYQPTPFGKANLLAKIHITKEPNKKRLKRIVKKLKSVAKN